MARELQCVLYTHVGNIGMAKNMNHLDLNVVGWYKHAPKADLRYWDSNNMPDGKAGGLTLDLNQLRALKALLNSVDLDNIPDIMSLGTKLNGSLDPRQSNLNEVREQLSKRNTDNSKVALLPWD